MENAFRMKGIFISVYILMTKVTNKVSLPIRHSSVQELPGWRKKAN